MTDTLTIGGKSGLLDSSTNKELPIVKIKSLGRLMGNTTGNLKAILVLDSKQGNRVATVFDGVVEEWQFHQLNSSDPNFSVTTKVILKIAPELLIQELKELF